MKETDRRKKAYEKCISLVSDKIYCCEHLIIVLEPEAYRYSKDIEELKSSLKILYDLKENMEYYMNEGE